MLTVEELLHNRYKVTNIWPDMGDYGMHQGQIITLVKMEDGGYGYPCKIVTYYKSWFENYPHLFQPLPWWSDRKVEDMPAFVKGGGNYYEHEYCITDGKMMFNQYCNGHPIGWLPVNKEFDFYTPVSDEEYQSFKQPTP